MRPIKFIVPAMVLAVSLAFAQQSGGLAERIQQIDKNGDGKISAEEFPGAQFKQMDKDGNGFVTLDEARAFYAGRGTTRPASERPENPPTRPVAAPAGGASTTNGVGWTDVYPIGTKDDGGQTMYGIQMMFLVPHKGKLFAANGTQGETETDKYPKAAQVLVLDSPSGRWKVDKQFTTDSPRVNSLISCTFTTDGTGRAVTPDTLLIAGPSSMRKQFSVFVRDDANGEWVGTPPIQMKRTPSFAPPRALAQHTDSVTGVQHLMVGIEGEGVFRGWYDPKAPARIVWNPDPEFVPEKLWQRVVGFAEANGKLYLSLSSSGDNLFSNEKDLLAHIYERTDGPNPSWKRILTTEPGNAWEDLRGLTGVPHPKQPDKQVLIFIWNDKVYSLDPLAGNRVEAEFDLREGIAKQTGMPVKKVVAGYDEFTPFQMPPGGEKVWLTGLCLFVRTSETSAQTLGGCLRDALYLIRRQAGDRVEYETRYIFKNDPANPTRTLMAVRDIAISPFPEDEGKVLYACGTDHQAQPMSLAAWIYRGDFRATDRKEAKP